MTSLAMIWKDVKRCGLFVSKFSDVFGLLCEMDHLLRKSKAKLQGNEESKGPNEPPKSRVPSWGWQTVEAFVIRSWAKRAASSYFGETHLIFPMAENKIWGLPCAVLPKKCPIRISRKSFLSQLFNKKFAVSESMSYPVWLSHEDAEIQYPPVYPSKGGSLLTSGVSPVFGHTLWTHPWNLQKMGVLWRFRGKKHCWWFIIIFPMNITIYITIASSAAGISTMFKQTPFSDRWKMGRWDNEPPILQGSPSGSLLPLLLARYQRFHAPHDGNLELWLRVDLPSGIQTWPTCSNFSRVDSICYS